MTLIPTVRLCILEATKDFLATMKDTLPEDDPYGFTPSVVKLGPLGDFDKRKRFTIGISVGKEIKLDRFPTKENTLPVNIEFQYQVQAGEGTPSVVAEHVLGAIQRRLSEIADPNRPAEFVDLIVDFRETGNDLVLESEEDKFIEGVVFWEFVYRHDHNDPRTRLKL